MDDANKLFNNLLSEINQLLDKYIPLKKITKSEFKMMYKPWITPGILKSIKRKDKLFDQYVKLKDKITIGNGKKFIQNILKCVVAAILILVLIFEKMFKNLGNGPPMIFHLLSDTPHDSSFTNGF